MGIEFQQHMMGEKEDAEYVFIDFARVDVGAYGEDYGLPPTEVHVIGTLNNYDDQGNGRRVGMMRFTNPDALSSFILALVDLRMRVWSEPEEGEYGG